MHVFVFFLLLLIVGCTIKPTYSVTGTVKDDKNQPVQGAIVTVGTQTTYTDSTGEFHFYAIREGFHTIKVSRAGYESKTTQIHVSKESTTFQITLKKLGDFFVAVNILDPLNQPIDAVSTLRNITTNTIIETKAGGSVTFHYLPAGNYQLSIVTANFKTHSSTFAISTESIEKTIKPEIIPASVSGTVQINASIASPQNLSPQRAVTAEIAQVAKTQKNKPYDGLLVQFYDDVDENQAITQLSKSQTKITTTKHKQQGLYKLTVNDPTDMTSLMESIQRLNGVKYVQPNYFNELLATESIPNDPNFYSQWNLDLINMPAAWMDIKGENNSIVVAVLDTGIRYHADLAANIVNGYDVVDNDSDPTDDVSLTSEASHGTHVASIIAAVTNNGQGMAGVGWNLKVMPVKVFARDPSSQTLGATDADIAEGIRYAVDHGAHVINLSLGGPEQNPTLHPVVEEALQYAQAHQVTVVAASGNAGAASIYYPASSQYTIAVGAVGSDSAPASYSNYGNGLDLTAPGGHGGAQLWPNWIMGYVDDTVAKGMTGTSQAAPHVAAVAGLLYSLGVTDPEEILTILIDSASYMGSDPRFGAGILNASEAVAIAMTNRSTASFVRIYAATTTDGYEWDLLEEIPFVYPDNDGYFVFNEFPTYPEQPIYLFGWYDVNSDGLLNDGDYYGHSSQGYTLTSNQHVTGVHFTAVKYNTTGLLNTKQNKSTVRILTK